MLLDRKTVREVVEAWAALLWRLEDGPGDDRRGRLTKIFKNRPSLMRMASKSRLVLTASQRSQSASLQVCRAADLLRQRRSAALAA